MWYHCSWCLCTRYTTFSCWSIWRLIFLGVHLRLQLTPPNAAPRHIHIWSGESNSLVNLAWLAKGMCQLHYCECSLVRLKPWAPSCSALVVHQSEADIYMTAALHLTSKNHQPLSDNSIRLHLAQTKRILGSDNTSTLMVAGTRGWLVRVRTKELNRYLSEQAPYVTAMRILSNENQDGLKQKKGTEGRLGEKKNAGFIRTATISARYFCVVGG